MKIIAVAHEAAVELERSVTIHGHMHGVHEGHSVIREEFEELWDEIKINPARDPGCLARRRKEAIQLAAMAMKFVVDVCDAPGKPSGGGIAYDAMAVGQVDIRKF